jgi:hypothetical protein
MGGSSNAEARDWSRTRMLCFICHLPAASAFADKIEMQGYWCWGKANADGAVQVVSFMVVIHSTLSMLMEMRLFANREII